METGLCCVRLISAADKVCFGGCSGHMADSRARVLPVTCVSRPKGSGQILEDFDKVGRSMDIIVDVE